MVLASASPRRADLLRQVGIAFTVVPAGIKEVVSKAVPAEAAAGLAVAKAQKVAADYPEALVIAADTMVVIEERILGKPRDRDEAFHMLSLLSGREHEVITGLAVQWKARGFERMVAETTRVWFRRLEAREIEAYIDSGEPFDKAGAYGIQGRGALLIEKIEGCYFNVVGLPLNRLGLILREVGLDLLGG